MTNSELIYTPGGGSEARRHGDNEDTQIKDRQQDAHQC